MKNPIQKQLQPLSVATFAILLATAAPLYASGDHAHGHDDQHESGMKHDDHGSDADHGDHHGSVQDEMFLVKKKIDGYDVSFHIMKAKLGKKNGWYS